MAQPKIDEQISYNWLFFLLAGAFGAVTFWAVYDESVTRREYKGYQETFFELETKLAQDAWDRSKKTLEATPEYVKLKAEQATLTADFNSKQAQYLDAEKKATESEYVAVDKRQTYTFTKSKMDEEYYKFTVSKHHLPAEPKDKASKEYEEYAKAKKDFEEHKAEYDRLGTQLDEDEKIAVVAEAEAAKLKAVQEAFVARKKQVAKRLEDLSRPTDELERKLLAVKDKKGGIFGPATEILQQNMEDMGRVDRCESCHLGSNRGGLEKVTPAYYRSHPNRRTLFSIHPVEKFGCTTCHDGQGRATTRFMAHARVDHPHDFEKHFWEEPLLKGPFMESECRQCHRNEYDLRANLRCESTDECPGDLTCGLLSTPVNPASNLHASIDAKMEEGQFCGKKIDKMVCSGNQTGDACSTDKDCEGKGRCVQNVDAVLVDLAPHLSRGRKIIEEAACYGCHPIEGYEGKPKAGPDLRHAAAKLNPGWMVEWILDPKAFRPKSRMPNFFPERKGTAGYPEKAKPQWSTDGVAAVKRVGEVDPERRRRALDLLKAESFRPEQQAAMMTSYLLANSTEYKVPAMPAGDAGRGEKLVDSLGCYGCHNLTKPGEKIEMAGRNRASHFDHGPDLGNVGSKTNPAWIYAWIKDPKSYAPGTRMPSLRLSDQEAADIATFLGGNKYVNGALKEYAAVADVDANNLDYQFLGKKLVNFYGCYGCHMVKGFETTAGVGAELTEFGIKDTARLDYGDYIVKHTEQTWEAWLQNKLEHPRVYRYERVDTKMPQFDLTPEEVKDVMVVLKGMRGRTKDGDVRAHKLTEMQEARERGRELVRFYNCYGCHTVDGHEGDIRQLKQYTDKEPGQETNMMRFAPPVLWGEGGKAQPGWLFNFLKKPTIIRPSLTVRMPTFEMTDVEATTLVQMFSAIDGADYPYHDYSDIKIEGERKQQGATVFAVAECLKCHALTDKVTPEKAKIGAPNLLLTRQRLRGEWLSRWLLNPAVLQPDVIMPTFFGTDVPFMGQDKQPGKSNLPGIGVVAQMKRDEALLLLRDYVMTLEPSAAAPATKPAAARQPAPTPAPAK